VSRGTVDIFTNDLCAKLSTATPHANSPSPELALEFAPPIHPGSRSAALPCCQSILDEHCDTVRYSLESDVSRRLEFRHVAMVCRYPALFFMGEAERC
jgi:hypothetical protein